MSDGDFLPWFDKYGDIPFSRETERLDTFARELAGYGPGSRGYIMVYAGHKLRKSAGQQRAERAKNYLVRKRGIGAARIHAIYAGRREKLEVELYIVPQNATAPTPHPTVDPSEIRLSNHPPSLRTNRHSE